MSNEKRERNAFQRFTFKIATLLRFILLKVYMNPLPWIVLTALVFGRFYELGYFNIRGATVKITGICRNIDGVLRADLAQTQVTISSVDKLFVEGIIRKTREYVKCEKSKVSVDRLGTSIVDLLSLDEVAKIPEIKKLKVVAKKNNEHLKLVNKDLLVSGICINATSRKKLAPFRDKMISVTNVQESEQSPGEFYFTGIREDNIPVVCQSKDTTYNIITTKKSKDADAKVDMTAFQEKKSYIGKKVFITSVCFPDMRLYRKLNRKPPVAFYNMQKTPVEVMEESIDEDGNVISIVGSILDRKKFNGKSMFGHKIICNQKDYSIVIVEAGDESVQVEKETK